MITYDHGRCPKCRKYDRCKKCNEWGWTDTHKCPPTWQLLYDDVHDPGEPVTVRGRNPTDVAIFYAEQNHGNWDYPDEMEIRVRRNPGDEWQIFNIEIGTAPTFTAYAVESNAKSNYPLPTNHQPQPRRI